MENPGAEGLHRLIDQAGLSSMLIVDLLAIIHRIDPSAIESRRAELQAELQTASFDMLPWIRRRLDVLSVQIE